MGNLDRFMPIPCIDPLDLRQVTHSNPQNNVLRCNLFRTCPIKESRELAERSRTDIIEGSHLFPEFFISPRKHLCILKSQFTNDFRKKSDLLDVRLDQVNS